MKEGLVELFSRGLKNMKMNFNYSSLASTIKDLDITVPLWSVLETRVRNRFPPPTTQKQLECVLKEEWYKIPPETVQNLYESIPRRTAAVLKAKGDAAPYY
jgi:hypothetical protein